MQRIALVTGATSGIGKAIVQLLSQHGFDLILCGRREDRLQSLQRELSKKSKVITLAFDVRNNAMVNKAFESLPDEWKEIDVLVNNAGNAHGMDPIQSGKIEDWDAMIDINVKGLLYVSHCIIPGMVDRQKGHIINIGSIAGKEVYPNGNVYSASKFAVDAITRGSRLDLNTSGIKVTSINPGLVETEFSLVRFKGDDQRAASVYKGYEPLQAADIADTVLFILTRPDHVVIADITIFPKAKASSTVVNKNL